MSNQNNSLLNSANLAWSQPYGVSLAPAAPKIEPVNNENDKENPETDIKSINVRDELEKVQEQFQKVGLEQDSAIIKPISNVDTSSYLSNSTTSTKPIDETNSDSATIIPPTNTCQTTSDAFVPPSVNLSSPVVNNEPQFQDVDYHWFFQKDPDQPDSWVPFSKYDSTNLEYGFQNGWQSTTALIPVNGTRYDVSLYDRTRTPIYWKGPSTKVQRCTWFFKRDSDYRFVPYSEEVSNILEYNYRDCFLTNSWYRRVDFGNNEFVVFYAAESVYHYISDGSSNQEGWGSMINETNMTPHYAYRGVHTIGIQLPREDTYQPVDHVIFMVHGIGDFCDISFRKLVEVVDDFREVSQELLSSHYSSASENDKEQNLSDEKQQSFKVFSESQEEKKKKNNIGRLEVLPISWHSVLHTQQLDAHLKKITLPSIPRMRSFTNDTILDALFYTSTPYAQTILMAVAAELNRIYTLFVSRNANFCGSIALGGHSLGSLILFDLLNHQSSSPGDYNSQTYQSEQLYFYPSCLFAFGSPIPVFLTVRGVYSLDNDYRLPTCRAFYNIFHPYDPIAYRLEPLINSELSKIKPVLVPHHKGRKRFHLELRESITRMGTDIKQKVLTSIKGTIDSIYGFVKYHNTSENDVGTEQNETNENKQTEVDEKAHTGVPTLTPSLTFEDLNDAEIMKNYSFGKLNDGRRIDYVLQERPIEIVNEYLFAIASHGCYWLSEDTALLVLRELYGNLS